jgi:hypothetical protein
MHVAVLTNDKALRAVQIYIYSQGLGMNDIVVGPIGHVEYRDMVIYPSSIYDLLRQYQERFTLHHGLDLTSNDINFRHDPGGEKEMCWLLTCLEDRLRSGELSVVEPSRNIPDFCTDLRIADKLFHVSIFAFREGFNMKLRLQVHCVESQIPDWESLCT